VLRHAFQALRGIPRGALVAALIALAASHPANAAGLLEFLFGSRPPAPSPQISSFTNPYDMPGALPGPGSYGQRSSGYCVRLCDGKYFPVNATGRVSATEMCEAFCPASATRLYSGGSIDYAFASDGSRYRDLKNAFVYRERLVDGCTCNGRTSAGLVPVDLALDSTLRTGDIVATNDGLYAYDGHSRNPDGPFTPVSNYAGLGADLRSRLSETKIAPATATTAPSTPVSPATPRIRRARLD
jgi:hypothetical protein